MKTKKTKSLLERKLEDPTYRLTFEQSFPAFQLEVLLCSALEETGLSSSEVAKLLGVTKSYIDRALSPSGVRSSSILKVTKIARALGMVFIPVLVPHHEQKELVPKIYHLVQNYKMKAKGA